MDILTSKNDSVTKLRNYLYIKVEIYDNEIHVDQKLNSYFGQVGIYENTEVLTSLVDNLYNDLDIKWNIYAEKFDYKEEEEIYLSDDFFCENDCNDLAEIEVNDSDIIDYYEEYGDELEELDNDDQEQNFKEEEDENGKENNEGDSSEDEEDYDYYEFFVPLVILFYRGDKRADYYISNEYKRSLFYDKKIIPFLQVLNLKKYINNNFFYKKFNLNKKNFLINYNNNRKNFFNLLNNSNITHLNLYFVNYYLYDFFKKNRSKIKLRLNMFKKLRVKRKKNNFLLRKNFEWFYNVNLLYLLNIKFFCFDNYYSHVNFINGCFYFFSQIKNIKNKFARKYRKSKRRRRRKKRFKKDIFRNFYGKRAKLSRILNYVEEYKKKRRR